MEKESSSVPPVPFQAHESDMIRMERSNKRLVFALAVVSIASIAIIALCVILLYQSNVRWMEAWASYDYVSDDVDVEGTYGGNARYVGDYSSYVEKDGVFYGTNPSQKAPQNQE